ncbi:hypothetical protein [Methylobacterium komagatae]
MTLPYVQRAKAVRECWPGDEPPPASLIHTVLRLRSCNRNTADTADILGVDQSEVARICEVDQDLRYEARQRFAATA